jgi:3-oxoacyl-[acyl-carrier protein] reductase
VLTLFKGGFRAFSRGIDHTSDLQKVKKMARKELENKVALITGGSRGIGAAISKRLASEGAHICINYKSNDNEANKLVKELEKEGVRAIAIQADLSKPSDVKALVASCVARLGGLDILVNNAGTAEVVPLSQVDESQIDRAFSLNVYGPLLAAKEAASYLHKNGGRIINISSVAARGFHAPGMAIYSASKAALEALTRGLAVEFGPDVTVNSVAPGPTETDLLQQVAKQMPAEALAMVKERTILKRIGTPDDIAEVVAFLASNASRWVTGQTIDASGGLT